MLKQKGGILIMTLILITASVLMTGFVIETAMYEIRIQDNHFQKLQVLNEADDSLIYIKNWLNKLYTEPNAQEQCHELNCITVFQDIKAEELNELSWWQTHAVRFNSPHYTYLITRQIERYEQPNLKTITVYYQTLVYTANIDEQAMTILQATFEKNFSTDKKINLAFPTKRISWQQLR